MKELTMNKSISSVANLFLAAVPILAIAFSALVDVAHYA
jgi:hypothetical protein